MKNLNPLVVIGSIGLIVTAILHIILVSAQSSLSQLFFVIYQVFAAMLTVGIIQIILERRAIKLKERRK